VLVALLAEVGGDLGAGALVRELAQALERVVVVAGVGQVRHEQRDALQRLDDFVDVVGLRRGRGDGDGRSCPGCGRARAELLAAGCL